MKWDKKYFFDIGSESNLASCPHRTSCFILVSTHLIEKLYNNMGLIHTNKSEFDEALNYFDEAHYK